MLRTPIKFTIIIQVEYKFTIFRDHYSSKCCGYFLDFVSIIYSPATRICHKSETFFGKPSPLSHKTCIPSPTCAQPHPYHPLPTPRPHPLISPNRNRLYTDWVTCNYIDSQKYKSSIPINNLRYWRILLIHKWIIMTHI